MISVTGSSVVVYSDVDEYSVVVCSVDSNSVVSVVSMVSVLVDDESGVIDSVVDERLSVVMPVVKSLVVDADEVPSSVEMSDSDVG